MFFEGNAFIASIAENPIYKRVKPDICVNLLCCLGLCGLWEHGISTSLRQICCMHQQKPPKQLARFQVCKKNIDFSAQSLKYSVSNRRIIPRRASLANTARFAIIDHYVHFPRRFHFAPRKIRPEVCLQLFPYNFQRQGINRGNISRAGCASPSTIHEFCNNVLHIAREYIETVRVSPFHSTSAPVASAIARMGTSVRPFTICGATSSSIVLTISP